MLSHECLQKLSLHVGQNPYGLPLGKGSRNLLKSMQFSQGDDEGEEMSVVGKTKEAILKLLQQCLGHASPNLSHYLFGFELNKDIKKSTFQQAGE